MSRLIAVTSLLLFLAPLAIGQQLYSQVGGEVNGAPLCSQQGTSKASCSGEWHNSGGTMAAGVTAVARDDFGYVQAGAGATANCSQDCQISAGAQTLAQFSDSATLQGVPSSGAYFLIKVAMSGFWTDRNYNQTTLQLSINGSNCFITAPNGKCYAYIPVNQDGTIPFSLTLSNNTVVNLQVSGGGNGTLSEGLSTQASITELAVVNQQGQVLNNVIITTASGHQYPQ